MPVYWEEPTPHNEVKLKNLELLFARLDLIRTRTRRKKRMATDIH